MREQFEKIPEISDLVEHFDFSDDTNTYHIRYDDMDDGRKRLDVMYLGGAWYAYQEQQKKIDELQAMVDSLTNINEPLVAYKNQLLDGLEEKGNKTGK